jgi:uncharacterized protein (DUF2147 family)
MSLSPSSVLSDIDVNRNNPARIMANVLNFFITFYFLNFNSQSISGKYYGKIVWLREPIDPVTGKPKTDKNNPDESLKKVPLKGFRMLKDFVYKGDGEWADGTIYDPQNGSTYNCVIKLRDDNTLDIRGYIGIKTFGRTDVWKRLVTKKKK